MVFGHLSSNMGKGCFLGPPRGMNAFAQRCHSVDCRKQVPSVQVMLQHFKAVLDQLSHYLLHALLDEGRRLKNNACSV